MTAPDEKDAQDRARRPLPPWAMRMLAFVAGLVVAVVANYVLYRIGIAGTPFIYVSF